MSKTLVLVLYWLPDGELARWVNDFPQFEFVDARDPEICRQRLGEAVITYGLPDVSLLQGAGDCAGFSWFRRGYPGLCVRWPGPKLFA